MAAVPSIGRASPVERPAAPGADAAGDLYERYSAQIFGYCFHQLGSREEAEDAVQTTFMNAFRGLARGIVPEAEQAWLFKIAHNVCLSRRRSSWRRGRIEAPNNMELLQEVVPAKEKVADELIRLQDVLEEMPDNQRRAILLREWQGLSYREIAAELELSQAAVETLIFRARRALAAGLEKTLVGSGWGKRVRRGADVGGVLAFVKAMLGGGGAAAVKVAAVVALAGATVATTAAHHLGRAHSSAAKAPSSASVAGPRRAANAPAVLRTPPPERARIRVPLRRTHARPHPALVRHGRALARHAVVRESAPGVVKPPAAAAPPSAATTEDAAPAPGARPEPVESPAAVAPTADSPKAPKTHGKPRPAADTPPATPADDAADPAPEVEPAPADASGNSGDHGQAGAPGQQDKGDKDNDDHGGNGHDK